MDDHPILAEADHWVYRYLIDHLPHHFVFHNYDHAAEVAEVAQKLAERADLPETARQALLLAAWFHDTGYVGGAEDHEKRSVAIFQEFARDHDLSDDLQRRVSELILSTERDSDPSADRSERILQDAGLAFLGRKRFERRANLLRLEWENQRAEPYTLLDWQHKMLDWQMSSRFLTAEAHQAYSKRKNKHIADLKEALRKGRKQSIRRQTGKDFGRGVDTVYRVTLRNHINLSSIADGKANMIISINTLVLSILITAGSAGFSLTDLAVSENVKFIIPVLLLMISSLSAIIFAVLSAIPKVSGQSFTRADVREHNISLLYFGNFLKLPKDEFVRYLRSLKTDQEVLYDDLSRDLYNLGVVLQEKYRLLSIAYRVFVGGLAVSVVVFLVTFFAL